MKKLLLSTVAFATLATGALAADLPSRRPAPAPYVAVPVFTWTGFYAGVNAGYGFGNNTDSRRNNFNQFVVGPASTNPANLFVAGTTLTANSGNRDSDGFVGGGQIGYNYQIGSFVIGIEADAQYADLGNGTQGRSFITATTPAGTPAANFAGGINSNIGQLDYFGTVRGRVGYAWDRVLVYGTGGFAYGAGGDSNRACVAAPGVVLGNCTQRGGDDLRTGWAAGGGVEYAFTPNLIGRIEGMYVSLERSAGSNFIGATNVGGVTTPVYLNNRQGSDMEFSVVRAGLSYKFNSF